MIKKITKAVKKAAKSAPRRAAAVKIEVNVKAKAKPKPAAKPAPPAKHKPATPAKPVAEPAAAPAPARRKPVVVAMAAPAAAPAAQAAPRTPSNAEVLKSFESAAGLFHAGEFRKAKAVFDDIAASGFLELAHSARSYARMCQQRLTREVRQPATPDEFYTYGVALVNQRHLPEARTALEAALGAEPQADHVLYALALCQGLQGDLAAAASSLRRAIELNPGNRAAARSDPDFQELLRHSPLSEVVSN